MGTQTVVGRLIEEQGIPWERIGLAIELTAGGAKKLVLRQGSIPRWRQVVQIAFILKVPARAIVDTDTGRWRRLADKTGAVEKEAQP